MVGKTPTKGLLAVWLTISEFFMWIFRILCINQEVRKCWRPKIRIPVTLFFLFITLPFSLIEEKANNLINVMYNGARNGGVLIWNPWIVRAHEKSAQISKFHFQMREFHAYVQIFGVFSIWLVIAYVFVGNVVTLTKRPRFGWFECSPLCFLPYNLYKLTVKN